jgi:hypothetical protein
MAVRTGGLVGVRADGSPARVGSQQPSSGHARPAKAGSRGSNTAQRILSVRISFTPARRLAVEKYRLRHADRVEPVRAAQVDEAGRPALAQPLSSIRRKAGSSWRS